MGDGYDILSVNLNSTMFKEIFFIDLLENEDAEESQREMYLIPEDLKIDIEAEIAMPL